MIETERLLLRPYRTEDFPAVAALFADPAVMRFIGGVPLRRDEAWVRFLRHVGHWSLFGHGVFAVVERVSGAVIGETGIADFQRGLGSAFDRHPEAAWALAPIAQGRGYAREAAGAAHDWFDARGGPQATVCLVSPDNAPSLALAAALGYRVMGETLYKERPATMLRRDVVR